MGAVAMDRSAGPTLRPATDADVEALFGVWSAAVDATHLFLTAEDRALFAGMVRDNYLPAAELVVAEVDGEPVAFMGLDGRNVDSLFVRPDRHGQGIGTAMLDHARAVAGEPLTVSVNEQNPQAVRFYERYGFRTVGRSELDEAGRPYPTLHMAMEATP